MVEFCPLRSCGGEPEGKPRGLMSYGPNFVELYSRAAEFVDRILRGTKLGNIPVEQPTKFDLVVNLTPPEGAWPRTSADAARPRRLGDRMSAPGEAGAIQPVEVRPKSRARPLGSECCVTAGDSSCEAYTAIAWGM
jgi:hypothetical protein